MLKPLKASFFEGEHTTPPLPSRGLQPLVGAYHMVDLPALWSYTSSAVLSYLIRATPDMETADMETLYRDVEETNQFHACERTAYKMPIKWSQLSTSPSKFSVSWPPPSKTYILRGDIISRCCARGCCTSRLMESTSTQMTVTRHISILSYHASLPRGCRGCKQRAAKAPPSGSLPPRGSIQLHGGEDVVHKVRRCEEPHAPHRQQDGEARQRAVADE